MVTISTPPILVERKGARERIQLWHSRPLTLKDELIRHSQNQNANAAMYSSFDHHLTN